MSEPPPDRSWLTYECGNCGNGDHISRGPFKGDCKSQYGPGLVVLWVCLPVFGMVALFFAWVALNGIWEAIS